MLRNIKISWKITSLVLSTTALAIVAVWLPAIHGNILSTEQFAYLAAGISAFAILLSLTFSKSILRPLEDMNFTLGLVAKGELPEKFGHGTTDEFGRINAQVEQLVSMLRLNADFAQKVGEGKFDAPFQAAGENDSLGMALMEMRDNLAENEVREKEQNWIAHGLAEAGEILRRLDSLEELGDKMAQFTIQKVNAIQGAFYTVEHDTKEIVLRTTYAYHRRKHLKKTFQFAEGLVGQAVAERDIVMRTEIPDDYVSITSGILNDQKPTCLVVVPLQVDEETFGALELAGFGTFDSSQLKFLKELSLMLARTIFNIRVNERTRNLLAEAQALSLDLKEKQEVLSQNAEEMRATQEELTRSNFLLEEQVEEVNRTRNRMQLLLENASEVITIYEADGIVRYISPSVEVILGYTPQELQGFRDIGNVQPEGREVVAGLFRQLALEPERKMTVQFEYKTKSGKTVWLEATGTNLMSNSAIHGYILNSRDITERRRAELEQRMRSKMQSLSENSTDLITRLENGTISYINPVIESYTGQTVNRFLHRKAEDTDLDHQVLNRWLQIVEDVNKTEEKISTEMDFPSLAGKRIMQVNAIPEFDEQDKLESVLVVSHDITERKKTEVDLQDKNKKINDSINYAKRIQNAILPDTDLISRVLPDSFILYKPRDVVSGDFPWFVQSDDDVFIAAVDCTGHGVPGALLSLIGYFLLNDIVKSRRVTDPGKILDLLDEGMTQTLKQDQGDAATKDGMDIALCRIDHKKRSIHYAGAHRPLYAFVQGAMTEIKGNKFPVGGGVFKNQTNFTTTSLTLCEGDSVFFSSDGYPDQFGGPEGKKLGSKRMRELVETVKDKKASEASVIFNTAWETWRGDHRQTDDVLLIGIRF